MEEPDGSIDPSKHDTARAEQLTARSPTPRSASRPTSPTRTTTSARSATTSAPGRTPGSPSPTSCAPPRPSAPSATAATASSTSPFPMYKQNASRDTCFEALIVRTPWPEFVAELERTRYDNAKYVPVTFVDYTSGYDSECAVLFPETFSTAERPPSNFGAIFCDREAERLRRVAGSAAEILRLNLPPDAACLLVSPELSRNAYIVWDLIHDRTHMRGDLPFDPFMIRQRSPYWMYSLEELRCDLTAFGEAARLEREGHPSARHVQYAILFDRLFRFPVTGTRVRNYDGLGGQLLFAFLHREGYLHWTDNRLTIEWERVADGVAPSASASRTSTTPGSTAPRSPSGSRPTTSSPPTSPPPRARGGRRRTATSPRSRSRSSSSTSSRTTSSRSASSTPPEAKLEPVLPGRPIAAAARRAQRISL